MTEDQAAPDAPRLTSIESVLLRVCAQGDPRATVCPTDVAKTAARESGGDDLAWRGLLTSVRRAAVGLAKNGRLVIYRKGKPADPDDFRGVYRLGLPHES